MQRLLEALKASATVIAAIVALTLWAARLEFRDSQAASRDELWQLRQEIQAIHAETRTIRLILCDGAAKDSYCRGGQ